MVFFVLVLNIVLSFITGFLVLKWLKRLTNYHFFNFFISTVLGFLLLTSVWAFYRIGHYTILIFIPFIGALLYYFTKPNFSVTHISIPLKYLIAFFSLALVIYLFEHWQHFLNGKGFSINGDFLIYSNISYYLGQNGYENYLPFQTSLEISLGNAPYRYFILWHAQIQSHIFNLPSSVSLLSVTFPFAQFLTAIGIFSFFEKYGKTNLTFIFISFILLFVGGISFLGSDFLNIGFLDGWHSNVFSQSARKLSTAYPIYLISFYFLLSNRIKESIIILLLLPIISIENFISVFGGIGILFLLNLKFKVIKTREAYFLLGLAIITSLLILIFYYIFSFSDSESGSIVSSSMDTIYTISSDDLKRIVRHFLGAGRLLIVYLPFLFLLVFVRKSIKEYIPIIILWLSIFLGGLLGSSLLIKILNFQEFYTNIGLSFFNVVLLVIFVKSISMGRYNMSSTILMISVLIASAYFTIRLNVKHKEEMRHSDAFISSVTKTLKENSNIKPIGFFLRTYKTSSIWSSHTSVESRGKFLSQIPGGYLTISLSELDLPPNPDPIVRSQQVGYLNQSSFYVFVEKQKKRNEFISEEKSQLEFLEKHKIKYGIVQSNYNLPEEIEMRIDTKIVDDKTGDYFIIIDY